VVVKPHLRSTSQVVGADGQDPAAFCGEKAFRRG